MYTTTNDLIVLFFYIMKYSRIGINKYQKSSNDNYVILRSRITFMYPFILRSPENESHKLFDPSP